MTKTSDVLQKSLKTNLLIISYYEFATSSFFWMAVWKILVEGHDTFLPYKMLQIGTIDMEQSSG